MSSSVEQIKERLDIATVVGMYVKLERAGSNFRARCPFHNEKTPSFMVSPDRGTYHCFGCNKGGDIFSFVEEIEGTDFAGALRILADKAGVVLTRDNPKEKDERERLHGILSDATLFFRKALRENSEALAYLKKRGLTGETIDEFQIGFAPNEWHALSEYLHTKGYRDDEIEKTGMSLRSTKPGQEGRFYDRFRSRIMFPLCDSSGRVVGFSGRIFGLDDPAKYVNSPQTALYDKSKILFGLSNAKSAIREAGAAIIVEGQMDLVMAHQSGTKNAVAVSGTALTGYHLETLKRFADKLYFAFDSDEAGLSAAKRSALPALVAGFDVHAIEIQGEKDPADLILEDPQKWHDAIKLSKHVVEFFLNVLEKKNPDPRAFRLGAEKNVLPMIARMESKIDQDHFVNVVASRIGVTRDAVAEEVKKAAAHVGNEDFLPTHSAPTPVSSSPVSKTRLQEIERKIHGVIFWQQSLSAPFVAPEMLLSRYQDIVGNAAILDDTEKSALIFEAEAFFGGSDLAQKHIDELFANFEKESLKESLVKTMTELQRAEMLHDSTKTAELLEKCKIISGKLNKLNMAG